MSLPRFFLEHQVISDEIESVFGLRLSESDLKHARALRLKQGEHLALIDATGDYFECSIESFSSEMLMVRVAQKQNFEIQEPTLVLVQGIAKGEKMDSIIRQGTELGIKGFIPFLCERSVVRFDAKKAQTRAKRWREIAKNAAMQSGQNAVPEVSHPLSLAEVCEFIAKANMVAICWEEEKTTSLKDLIATSLAKQHIEPCDARIVVVVGPEGGLTSEEVASLTEANRYAGSVTLGSSILRTETAGILAPALVLYELGGFK